MAASGRVPPNVRTGTATRAAGRTTVRKIIAAAKNLLRREGYAQFSMRTVADAAGVDMGDGIGPVLVAALPLADLDHAVVALLGGDHRAALGDRVAERLFAIGVLAGRHGVGELERVPVVGRGDDHRVDRLVVEHAAVVAV